MDAESRLTNHQLFARWARQDIHAWQRAVGADITHLSRGDGRVTAVSREQGEVSVHVQYARAQHEHPLWEFRTEIHRMTYPEGLTRAEMIPAVREQRLQDEEDKRSAHAAP